MFYTIYRTINLLNGKFYTGKHQTKNLHDGYFGSGKLLVRAVNKHGIENFVTEIIAVYDFEWQMNLAERILAVVDFEVSYNLCAGGKGGFGYINTNGLKNTIKQREAARNFLINLNRKGYNRVSTAGKPRPYAAKNMKIARLLANTPEAIKKKKASLPESDMLKMKKIHNLEKFGLQMGLEILRLRKIN